MKHLLLVFLLISSPTLAMHHSSDDEQIIFLLDLNIIEDQSNNVDDLIKRLVSNVKATAVSYTHLTLPTICSV